MVVDSNLHQLLDSAVKTAVYRLATSPDTHRQEPAAYNTNPIRNPQLHRTGQSGHRSVNNHNQQEQIDRSRVDFLYYDGGNPEYEYYYYEDGDYNELERYDVRAPNNPPPWVAAQSKFNRYTKHQKKNSGFNTYNHQSQYSAAEQKKPSIRRPHTGPANDRVDVAGGDSAISRVGNFFFNSPVGAFLPLILAAPLILLAMYYLLVVNAPTPVVKERMVETANTVMAAVKDVVLNGDLLGENAAGNLEVLGDFLLQMFSESS